MIALWDGAAPGSEDWTQQEQVSSSTFLSGGAATIRNVTVPTLTPYVAPSAGERAVIVCPGGALQFLAIESEGSAVAEMLCDAGIDAFVLKYRVAPTPADDEEFLRSLAEGFRSGSAARQNALPFAVADCKRAMEIVRDRGYSHLTLLGFSAGGSVTADVVLGGDGRARPDAAAIFYLPSVDETSTDADLPPLFVCAAVDDMLGIDGSLALQRMWSQVGAPVELHLFERGGHGFGMAATGLPVDSWPQLFVSWLASRH